MNLAARPWDLIESPGATARTKGSATVLTIPVIGRGHLNYAVSTERIEIPGEARRITLSGSLEGAGPDNAPIPAGEAMPGGMPANFRAMLMRDLVGPWGRFWVTRCLYLATAGPFYLEAPLWPGGWTSVYGKPGNDSPAALRGWNRLRHGPLRIGITFGGNNHYGHGVRMATRPVRVVVRRCVVE